MLLFENAHRDSRHHEAHPRFDQVRDSVTCCLPRRASVCLESNTAFNVLIACRSSTSDQAENASFASPIEQVHHFTVILPHRMQGMLASLALGRSTTSEEHPTCRGIWARYFALFTGGLRGLAGHATVKREETTGSHLRRDAGISPSGQCRPHDHTGAGDGSVVATAARVACLTPRLPCQP